MSPRARRLALAITAAALLAGGAAAWQHARPQFRIRALSRLLAEHRHRAVRARLSDFMYAAEPQPTHKSKNDVDAARITAHTAAVIRDYAASSRASELHAAGIGLLIAGRPRQAIATLERAGAMSPRNVRIWSDLSAARLAWYDSHGEAPQLVAALANADRALRLSPERAEPLLNRALILEAMGLHAAAADAYAKFLAAEAKGAWATEARNRLSQVLQRTRIEIWEQASQQIRTAAKLNDREGVRKVVAAFPQDVRATGETTWLTEWAAGALCSDAAAAQDALRLASAAGEALARFNGDTLLHDAAAAIHQTEDQVRIADAQRDYDNGRKAYAARDLTASRSLLARAHRGFRVAKSPMAAVAEFYVACVLYDSGDGSAALAIIDRLERTVPQSHMALRGFLAWEKGTVLSRSARFHEALAAQVKSTEIFERLSENGNANVVASMAAGTQSVLGRRVAAWRTRISIFSRISRSGDLGDLQRAIDLAARTEALAGEWENTFSLMSLAITPRMEKNTRIQVSSLIWHALAAHRLGITGVVDRDLMKARTIASRITDSAIRTRAQQDIVFCEAVTLRTVQPRRAAELFDGYIAAARRGGNLFLLSEALLERGRAYGRLEVRDRAIADLRESLALARRASTTMQATQLRDAYFRTAESAASELAHALVLEGKPVEALAVIDEERARPYARSTAAIPRHWTVVEYVVVNDELLAFIVAGGSTQIVRTPLRMRELHDLAAALEQGRGSLHDPVVMTRLGGLLVNPIERELSHAQHLVIVPDPAISWVPFAALPLRSGARMLIDETEIAIAPSAAVAAASIIGVRAAPTSVLAVGDPALDRARFADLGTLPAAAREAHRIAREYPVAETLTGPAATRQAILAALQRSDVVHMGTHAVLLQNEPAKSHVLLAPGNSDSGILYLSEIESATLRATQLVVLAGCETAAPPAVRRNVDTLALAFVAAGATNVIGSLWRVEDDATEKLATMLHRELRRGKRPAEALRHAQMEMRRSPIPAFRRASSWAGFQVYGSGE